MASSGSLRRILGAAASSWSVTSSRRVTSRCRYSATVRGTSSHWASGIARCSAAIKKSSRKLPRRDYRQPYAIGCTTPRFAWAGLCATDPPAQWNSSTTFARREFFFLEVNTRLQVEHCVTEEVTGIDLVEWMVRLAANDGFHLAAPASSGASIQVRIYAEDPARGFRPSSGTLTRARFAAEARVDTWVEDGTVVTPHYDPLLAKIIVTDTDRDAAVAKLRRVLNGTEIAGIETNLDYVRQLAATDAICARLHDHSRARHVFLQAANPRSSQRRYTDDYPGLSRPAPLLECGRAALGTDGQPVVSLGATAPSATWTMPRRSRSPCPGRRLNSTPMRSCA